MTMAVELHLGAKLMSLICSTLIGWSRHPVCVKKYHFIIRNEKMASCKTCRRCGLMVQLFQTRCPACSHGSALPHDESEDWDYAQIDDPRHLLHGIVHENGFGHLVRINGHEGGSSLLTGYQLMDFWDRLCTYLRVRKVSVLDVSKKFEVDYRVLHAIATGCSWYGQWGFKLGSGSFGITSETYSKAIENLSSVSLSHFFPHSRYPRNQLQDTIAFYQSLSKRPLTTFRDLFLYVLGLAAGKSVHTHLVTMHKRELAYDANFKEENWADEKIKQAMDVVLKVLRAADRWVAMRTLKAATAHPIGSPQLVDYCLKTIGGTRTYDGMVVVVRCNSETNTIEYRFVTQILVVTCITSLVLVSMIKRLTVLLLIAGSQMKSCHQRMRACQLGNTFSVTSSSSMMRSSTLIQCNLISQNIFMNMPTDLRWSFWTASSSSSIMTWKRISCLKTNLCCTSGAKWSYWIRLVIHPASQQNF
uniref:PTC1-like winged helix-turn-helix domain-containing protein n=1 Tax=Aegilops tauschii subsp. strangulata TaxID=200361 RepID=A0A453HGF5_AEGTS